MVFVGDYIYEGRGAPATYAHVGARRGRSRTTEPARPVQDRRVPSASARRGAVAGDLGRSRGREQLRGTRDEALDPNFRKRRAAAYQAYFEHMPLRKQARPTRSGVILRARHDFGRLARFHVFMAASAELRRPAPGPAAGARAPSTGAARSCANRNGRCSAPSRSDGWRGAWQRRPGGGISWLSRR